MSTLIVFPDPGNPGATTCNGTVSRQILADTSDWNDLVTGVGTAFGQGSSQTAILTIVSRGTLDFWQTLRRSIFLFDTSALTAGATITAAVLSIKGTAKVDNLAVTPNIDIYTSTPGSNTQLASTDYPQLGTTSQTGAPITYAGWSTVAYNDFTFSATGRGNISKTGISKFGVRNANYDVANVAPTWSASATSSFSASLADDTGNEPLLTITYSTTAGPANLKSYNTNLAANIKSIDTNLIANVKSLDTNV